MVVLGVLLASATLGAVARRRRARGGISGAIVWLAIAVVALAPAAAAQYGRFDDVFREPGDPPYEQPTIVLRFAWEPISDIRMHYLLITDEHDPQTYSFGAAYWYAGCDSGAFDAEPAAPLVLQAGVESPARNWATLPGVYWVAVQSSGYCIYPDDSSRLDRALEAIPEGTEIPVTVTIETYEPGFAAPSTEVLTARVPVFLDVRDLPGTRQVLRSVTLQPGTGATSSTTTTTTTTTEAEATTTEAGSQSDESRDGAAAAERRDRGPSALALALAALLILAVIGGAAAMLALRLDIEGKGGLARLVRFIRRLFGGKASPPPPPPPPGPPPPPPPPPG